MSARQLAGERLIIASHNDGKIREITALLAPFGTSVVSATELGLPEPEETGATFVENARLKAGAAARTGNLPALADDSGFAVKALGGAPGIYSARWAGLERDFRQAMATVKQMMRGAEDRSARFVCALAVGWPDGESLAVEGSVSGTVIWPPRGNNGFGYDPIFVPEGHDLTFGEMDPTTKCTISHRTDAFNKLVHACFGEH